MLERERKSDELGGSMGDGYFCHCGVNRATQFVGCERQWRAQREREGSEQAKGKVMSLCFMREGFRIGDSTNMNLSIPLLVNATRLK
ncbi:hypothetical protein VNO77_22070 [Canavalia gladiata]|uniref:Uncharacterized protein n=1 Tax=Canavalia gladiata TaxID=3824 RepID=A0AAN9L2X1_CANGL